GCSRSSPSVVFESARFQIRMRTMLNSGAAASRSAPSRGGARRPPRVRSRRGTNAGQRAAAAGPRQTTRWCASEVSPWLVAPLAGADGDHGHPLWPCDRHTCGLGLEAHDRAAAHGYLFALDAVDARSADDHVDLFLLRVLLVVL